MPGSLLQRRWVGIVALICLSVCGTIAATEPDIEPGPAIPYRETVLATPVGDRAGGFGLRMAASGDTLIVGNPGDDRVYVFIREDREWRLQDKLLFGGSSAFGVGVAIDGDTAVSAVRDSGETWSGSVLVYQRFGTFWQTQAKLLRNLITLDHSFGESMALDGDLLAVAAAAEAQPAGNRGAVYLFRRTGETWSQIARLTAPGPAADLFGYGLSLSGSRLAVGALAEDHSGHEDAGAVYTFVESEGNWVLEDRITSGTPAAGAGFGEAVVLQDDQLVVSAPRDPVNGKTGVGAVYTFERNPAGEWQQQVRIKDDELPANCLFGMSLALEGGRLAVGAPGVVSAITAYSGAVYLYDRTAEGWNSGPRLTPGNQRNAGYLGQKVVLGDQYVAAGAPYAPTGGLVSIFGFVPEVPQELKIQAQSPSSMLLSWTDRSTDELGFEVYRSTGNSGIYNLVAAVGANAEVYEDTGLVASTRYTYRIRAFNANGGTEFTAPVSAVTPTSAPFPPTGLAAQALSGTEIRLTWTDGSSDETGFRLERSADGIAYVEIEALGVNATSYVDEPGSTTAFHYRVRAENAGGFSPYSNSVQASVLPAPPAPPTGLDAEVQSSTAILLSWTDASDNESGFEVERSDDEGDNYSQVTKVGTGTTQYRATGLRPGAFYLFRIRAFNAGGNSEYSSTVEAFTLPEKPEAPTALTATAVSSTSVQLNWADASGTETAYRVERRRGSGGYQEIAFLDANTIAYLDDAVVSATTYTYRVRASNSGGSSVYSNEAEVTTIGGPPNAPAGLSASVVSADRIELTWTDTSDSETGFRVERRIPSQSFQALVDLAAGATSYSNEGLAAGTTYLYRVRAFNTGGTSAPSDEVSATTLPAAPSVPSNLTATLLSATEVRLTWTDTSPNESAFKVERKKGADSFSLLATLGANSTTFRDGGLDPAATYTYQLRAVNAGGESVASDPASITTPPAPPAPPANLTAVAISSSQIDLSWTDASSNETGFRVERRAAGSAFTLRAEKGANVTTHSDLGLAAGTTYTYRVSALNVGGTSAHSDEVSATTRPSAPAAPANLTVEVISSTVLRLEWEDRSDNESGFRIFRSLNGGTLGGIADVGANVAFYRDGPLPAQATCVYRVQAFNAGGDSAFSASAQGTTLPQSPAPPNGVQATALSSTEIRLDWTDNSINESGFLVERKIGAGAYARLALLGANTITFRDAGLQPATSFTYRLRAINAGGESPDSGEAQATTLPLLPEAPTGLTVTIVSTQALDVTWTDVSNSETHFDLERRPLSGPFVRIAQPGAGSTSFRDGNLSPNTTYVYRVRAVNGGGASAYSPEAAGTTLPLVPTSPDGLIVSTISSSVLRLDWNDRSDNETGFRIERSTGESFTLLTVLGSNVATYRDTGLAADTSYRYRVRAMNTGGESGSSPEAEGRTFPLAPSSPTGLSAQVLSQRSVRLNWQDASANETGFELERKIGGASGPGAFQLVATLSSGGTEFVDTGLSPGTLYTYRVRAINTGGGSPHAGPVEATTRPDPPSAPDGFDAQPVSQTLIRLEWVDTSGNETGFEIQQRLGTGAWTALTTTAANATSYDHAGLIGGSTYSYRVRAINTGGASSFSNVATATTYALNAPTKLVAVRATATSIRLNWTDSTQGEAGFSIERRTASTGYLEIKRVKANAKTYTDTRLTRGESYTYRIRGFRLGGGFSPYSNEASLLLPAQASRKRRQVAVVR